MAKNETKTDAAPEVADKPDTVVGVAGEVKVSASIDNLSDTVKEFIKPTPVSGLIGKKVTVTNLADGFPLVNPYTKQEFHPHVETIAKEFDSFLEGQLGHGRISAVEAA